MAWLWGFTSEDRELELMLINCCSWLILASGVAVLVMYCMGFSLQLSYGRYNEHSPAACCGSISARKAWVIQESPCLVVPMLILLCTECKKTNGLELTPNVVLISLFLIHYVQRTVIYPLCIKGGKPTPFPPMIVAILFCCINGYLQARTHTQYYHYDKGAVWTLRFIIGVGLFVVGMAINIHSDSILRNLRKPGERGYKIPRGGVFEFVSGANFFGESLEWTGYAVISWSFAATAFAVFTICYTGTRACKHHQYYLSKFEDYPKSRKSFIPFIL